MVTLIEKNIMHELYYELRECAQVNNCILCREGTPETYCWKADEILKQLFGM